MVSKPDTELAEMGANEDAGPKGIDCEIQHQLEKTKYSLQARVWQR